MHAFCSTPYFEPFAIPLILDKLSSSLPLAKIDSLKYLKNCMPSFGGDRMLQHAQHIWTALKDVIFNLPPKLEALSLTPDSGRDMKSDENEIATEALTCLKEAVLVYTCPDGDVFLSLIINDTDIEESFTSITLQRNRFDSPDKVDSQLSVLGSILSVTATTSSFCCGRVFQKFFSRLMIILEVPAQNSKYGQDATTKVASRKLNYGALCLCVLLLTSGRDLIATSLESSVGMEMLQDSWWYLIQDFSVPLTSTFKSALEISNIVVSESANSNQEHVFCCVKGLQVLATYPGPYSPITKDVFEDIIAAFMSVITGSSSDSYLWKLSLKSLTMIGTSITRFNDLDRQIIYNKIVVKQLVFLLVQKDSTSSIAPTLEAASEIGICGLDYMLQVIPAIEDAIISSFMQACVDGNCKTIKVLVLLLDCYCSKVLSWSHNSGKLEAPGMSFAIGILGCMENIIDLKIEPRMQDLLNRMMMALQLVVRGCKEHDQHKVLHKAFNVLQASGCFPVGSLPLPSGIYELSQFTQDLSEFTCREEWLLYFTASIVMALHQQTPVPDGGKLLNLFLVFLLKGHLAAAHALASLINKWPTGFDILGLSKAYTLDGTIDLIVTLLSNILLDNPGRAVTMMNNEGRPTQFFSNLQIHAVIGLGWIGKALLLRGHDRLKDITMILMKCLLLCENEMPSLSSDGSDTCNGKDLQYLVARSAADAFRILLSDSEVCLTKNFHAIIKPLGKQRFFSSMLPILHTSVKDCNSSRTRTLLYQAFGHIVCEVPLIVLIAEAKKVIPLLLEALSALDGDIMNKDLLYCLLLVLSGFLMDEKGKEEIIDYVHVVINHLIKLISYPHMTLVRETTIQCLVAVTGLSYTRIYPMRTKVLRALSRALDDKKRFVRQEAVKCYHAWASMASRSLR
ncbi:hypothetical protein AXF42_Ash002534 [Apostasia shenzhenica]|uniref:MMS19 nucleotide excision repair protein n=1 Tax=Apostasia shenzhenica TaxID=1088818 RepID=A0A2I0ANU2_9ASPA|nr:hypothetical protein AXF42_Ash002534 [Apostasia shenzhenica]